MPAFRMNTIPGGFNPNRRSVPLGTMTGVGPQLQFNSVPSWMLPELSIAFTPTHPIAQALAGFPDAIQKTLMRQSVLSAMRPLRRAARTYLKLATAGSRWSTGAAYRSLDIIVRQKPGTMTTYGVVGARRGHMEQHSVWSYIPRREGGPAWGDAIRRRVPTRYLHLAEKGFTHWMTGKRVKGRLFLQRAITNGKGAATVAFEQTLTRGVNRHLAALAGRLHVKPQVLTP